MSHKMFKCTHIESFNGLKWLTQQFYWENLNPPEFLDSL